MLHGLFDLPLVESLCVVKIPLLELARSPQVLTPAVLGVLLVYFCRGAALRWSLIAFSCVLLAAAGGVYFTGGVLAGCLALYATALLLSSWQRRAPDSRLPM